MDNTLNKIMDNKLKRYHLSIRITSDYAGDIDFNELEIYTYYHVNGDRVMLEVMRWLKGLNILNSKYEIETLQLERMSDADFDSINHSNLLIPIINS